MIETTTYCFTARERDSEETFTFPGHLFPGGEVLVPNDDRAAEWYADLDSVAAWDAEVIEFEPTGETLFFSEEELAACLRQSVEDSKAHGLDPREYIPASLHACAMWYELEGNDGGCWSVSNASPNPDATRFDTLDEAMEELDYWEGEGRDITTLRVVKVSLTDREVVYQPPAGELYEWETDRCGNHNVMVNDGTLTYYSVWDTDDDERTIALQEVATEFAAGYDHNGEPGPVSIVVTNLITGEELEDEIEPETDELDEDDDTDDDEDEQ